MAFFKKWKNNSAKHRKLSEEWALATSLKDFTENQDELLDSSSNADESSSDLEAFTVKYLGNTIIESARSEEATAEAVKAIISTAKATNKKLQRVILNVSPKGIEILDAVTSETLIRVSIYKISYCSADAAHSNVFAFVGSEDQSPLSNKPEDSLVCFAFLCQKRKIAQKVTLTVAHSFEAAYQIWQDAAERKKYQLERRYREQRKHSIEVGTDSSCTSANNDDIRNLLIDFSSEITAGICSKDHRDLLQNTWVSFDEDCAVQQQHTFSNLNNSSNLWGEKSLINCS